MLIEGKCKAEGPEARVTPIAGASKSYTCLDLVILSSAEIHSSASTEVNRGCSHDGVNCGSSAYL